MEEIFDTIRTNIIKRIKDDGEVNEDFLQKYMEEYDDNLMEDLDIILEDLNDSLNAFIDEVIYGIEDYKMELLENE